MALKSLHSRNIIGRMWQALTSPGNEGWIGALSGPPIETTQEEETFAGIGTIPGLRVWEGARKSVQLLSRNFAIRNEKYEATLRIEGKDLRRALAGAMGVVGQVERRIGMLRVRYDQHWAKLLTTLITGGDANVGYDGVNFFATTHTENGQANQSNLLTFAAATGTTPTAAEFEGALVQAITQLQLLTDDSGEPVNMDSNRFIVMIPPALLSVASVALKAPLVVDAVVAGVRTNVLTVMAGYSFEIVVNPRLTEANVFYLFVADGSAFIRLTELGLKISSKAEGSEWEHDYDAHEYGILTIRGAGYGSWQGSIQTSFT